jgi:hypothetical protein
MPHPNDELLEFTAELKTLTLPTVETPPSEDP